MVREVPRYLQVGAETPAPWTSGRPPSLVHHMQSEGNAGLCTDEMKLGVN